MYWRNSIFLWDLLFGWPGNIFDVNVPLSVAYMQLYLYAFERGMLKLQHEGSIVSVLCIDQKLLADVHTIPLSVFVQLSVQLSWHHVNAAPEMLIHPPIFNVNIWIHGLHTLGLLKNNIQVSIVNFGRFRELLYWRNSIFLKDILFGWPGDTFDVYMPVPVTYMHLYLYAFTRGMFKLYNEGSIIFVLCIDQVIGKCVRTIPSSHSVQLSIPTCCDTLWTLLQKC